MFVDYYKILEIEKNSTQQEIKTAFRKQAIRWHPDKNPNIDVNEKMQLINEAYLMLKDEEARYHYDIEHTKFGEFYKSKKERNFSSGFGKKEKQEVYEEYNFNDETLKKWMQNAKKQAVDLAKQTIKEIGELSVNATKEAGSKMIETFVYYSIAGLLMMFLLRACN
ncbi:DnaJ domain-containing protein [Flavobacterium psychraquaticum]|uniref:DnaJ domain-containing protein n=1 Tax=Flavobacterium psychraquaticum TaxID=3103958 RepID=UPI002ACE30B7|nr:DnaJ domain-containing protein [Flavobacterium sp. LB-N7T]